MAWFLPRRFVASAAFVVSLALLSGPAFAQSQTTDDPKRFSERFMQQLMIGTEQAIKLLREQSAIGQLSGFPVFSEQFRNAIQQDGSVLRYEFLKDIKVGDSLLQQHYLIVQRQRALYVRITYYKAQQYWSLNNFHFTSKVEEFPF